MQKIPAPIIVTLVVAAVLLLSFVVFKSVSQTWQRYRQHPGDKRRNSAEQSQKCAATAP